MRKQSEIICPYCEKVQEDPQLFISGSDGDEEFINCEECKREFTAVLTVVYSYEIYKLDTIGGN